MRKGIVVLIFAIALSRSGHAPAAEGPPVAELYAAARKYDKATFRFKAPSADRAQAVEELVRAVVVAVRAGRAPSALAPKARRLGFDLTAARDAAGPVWVLREAGDRRDGDGFFAFRPHAKDLCVQAPHTFFDEQTGDVALAVFAETRAAALFVNTVHRYAPSDDGEGAADVAHAPRSLFASATDAWLAATASAVLQIHGFGEREHLPADVAAVVSDGQRARETAGRAERFRRALQERLTGRVMLFGVDTDELGATTNVQGKAARKAGAPFVHVELARTVRAQPSLVATAIARAAGNALLGEH